KYDPYTLDLDHFMADPGAAWVLIKEIFYDFFGKAKPNRAHRVLARMEQEGLLARTITQNIDNLHQEAGSRIITEFHGSCGTLTCLHCNREYRASEISLDHLPPTCRECGGVLKPAFVFFGEAIPARAMSESAEAASWSDIFLIIGTTGEVMPANQLPLIAKQAGAKIIEINPEPSHYTEHVTDIFLQGKATEVMGALEDRLFASPLDDDQHCVD
ncbi:MAG TPA: Sir2 family NAD-dependent protein deacetylase, partial [Bacteroidales bacterium]|nr:Sir2 family NAD-dependent protein deacetylase [Bacteroidales bacterium]